MDRLGVVRAPRGGGIGSPPCGRRSKRHRKDILGDGGLDQRGLAGRRPGASLDAPTLCGAIEGARDVKIRAILTPALRVFTSAAFDAAPVAEVA